MIVSLNWLKQFTDIDMPVAELATLIGARLVEIEKVVNLGEKYKDALIVKVVSAEKMPESDHLSIVKIDDGGVLGGLNRDEDNYIQVVCGAPNIATGQMVVWLPPESIVPETFDKTEQFKLGIRDLRGVTSSGMIASGKELALSEDHDGILVIEDDFKPGTLLADAYELNDYLLDIENKSLTHRPDCFGIVGFAREVAGICGKTFKTPDWLTNLSTDFGISSSNVNLNAFIDDSNLCSRYMAVVLSGADSKKKSPLKFQTYLSRVGVRPINAVVDVTNYLMMLTGQPLHAFDYDKLTNLNNGIAEIHVRSGRSGEKLGLLDGKSIDLSIDDIVIASGDVAIGLAGAMGGANTEIDENTTRIIVESATFNLYKLRATQMRHGVFSEAITRFTKGQPAELAAPVLNMAVQLLGEWSGAMPITMVVDTYPEKENQLAIEITVDSINQILGSNIDTDKIINLLESTEFNVKNDSGTLSVIAPYWRSDIHINEDVVEEVGRLSGFDNINPLLPGRDFTAVKPSEFDDFRKKIRKILVRAGSNEIFSYSFIHGDVLNKANQDVNNSYKIINSISPDLQYYRQSLTPSLLGFVNSNIRQGFDSFAIFEINKVHQKQDGLTDEGVPVETDMLSLVIADKNQKKGAPYYQAKRILDYICQVLGINLDIKAIGSDFSDALSMPFEYRRCAIIESSGKNIGTVGEYRKTVIRNFKLPDDIAGFEINLRELFNVVSLAGTSYRPLSRYPSSDRDICFKVSDSVNYQDIIDNIHASLDGLSVSYEISPVDIYQAENSGTKNITVKIRFISYDHTMDSKEVTDMVTTVSNAVVEKLDASVV